MHKSVSREEISDVVNYLCSVGSPVGWWVWFLWLTCNVFPIQTVLNISNLNVSLPPSAPASPLFKLQCSRSYLLTSLLNFTYDLSFCPCSPIQCTCAHMHCLPTAAVGKVPGCVVQANCPTSAFLPTPFHAQVQQSSPFLCRKLPSLMDFPNRS